MGKTLSVFKLDSYIENVRGINSVDDYEEEVTDERQLNTYWMRERSAADRQREKERKELEQSRISVTDIYYAGNLVKTFYSRGFVQSALKQAESCESFKVFENADRYDGSLLNGDLSKHLKKLGFYGVF